MIGEGAGGKRRVGRTGCSLCSGPFLTTTEGVELSGEVASAKFVPFGSLIATLRSKLGYPGGLGHSYPTSTPFIEVKVSKRDRLGKTMGAGCQGRCLHDQISFGQFTRRKIVEEKLES